MRDSVCSDALLCLLLPANKGTREIRLLEYQPRVRAPQLIPAIAERVGDLFEVLLILTGII